jgi:thymidylate synthase (FAD)
VSRVQILDHGYLEVVETWGSDERIIEAARMSTDKGFQGWGPRHRVDCAVLQEPPPGTHPCDCPKDQPGDEKLLAYLWKNKHATPFEMAGAIIEVQAPIFVFREWHRHRTQSFNELSARYTPMPATDYVPTVDRLLLNAGSSNKQASTAAGAKELTESAARTWLFELERLQRQAQEVYEAGLSAGVPKELARLPVTVSRYSRMRASANLRNWLAFLTLRNHPAAQWEIRQYAAALQAELANVFPRTIALFEEGVA